MAGFRILTVCSGNICRSPAVEQALRTRLADVSEITVASAGTVAMVGEPMPEQARTMSLSLGGDPTNHSPQQLTEKLIDDAGLVLAMAREHRRAIVELVPRASRYTVTIREFARLSAGLGAWELLEITALPHRAVAQRLEALVTLIASRRGQVDVPDLPSDDDVVDPYQQNDARYEQTRAQLAPAIDEVVRVIRLALAPGGAVA